MEAEAFSPLKQGRGKKGFSPGDSDDQPLSSAEEELTNIALESSQAERRADEAERELMEWKKIKFMQDRIGEEFHATVLSCTKYGFFVELDELFIEGLVPIQTIADNLPYREQERYIFRDTDRAIVGQSSGRTFKLGQRVHVLLDRIDRPQRRLQFALVPDEAPAKPKTPRKPKPAKITKPAPNPLHTSPTRSGKPGKTKSKARERTKKAKGKRK